MISNSINARYLFCSRFRNRIAIHGSNPSFSSFGAAASFHERAHNSGPYEHGVGKTTGALFFSSTAARSATSTLTGTTGRNTNNANKPIKNNTSTSMTVPMTMKNVTSTSNSNSKTRCVGTQQQFGATSTSIRAKASSAATTHEQQQQQPPPPTKFRSVYVHPLSHIVLEYLQNCRHEWIVKNGLDQSLIINRDGSFAMKAPVASLSSSYEQYPAPTRRNTSSTMKSIQSYVDDHVTNTVRIWTCYDEKDKKHWLTVRKGVTLRQQFLLQDNTVSLLAPWNNTLRNERIHLAVNAMIDAVDQVLVEDEKKKKNQHNNNNNRSA